MSRTYFLLLVASFFLAFTSWPSLKAAEGDYALGLKSVVNMDFADDEAGNGKGGWSDQGPQNDMRGFDVTRSDYGGIRFAVIDPATNNHRAVMTFDSANAHTGLTTATVNVPTDAPARPFLYLLHTSCWNQVPKGTTIGLVEVTYADGQKSAHEIKSGVDIADWWGAGALPNGMIVLRKANASTHVGLYMTKFALPQPAKPVRSVTFKSEGKVVWIVLGATLSARDVDMKVRTVLFTANDEWKPVDMSDVRVKAGSALDFSSLVETGPAGKHGRVIATPDGRLAFADSPDKEQRFFGYNMVLIGVFGTFTGKNDEETKANIREYVALVKRQGYNVLRSLCLDTYLMGQSQKDLEINPARFDVFDYFVSVMKQEGVYLYLDLGSYGLYYKGTWEEKITNRNLYAEIFAGNPATRENWKQGVTQLLNHVNPYTKTALRDDPMVVCVNFYNEQELGFNKLNTPKERAAYEPLWRNWLKGRYHSVAEVAKAWNDPAIAKLQSIDEIPLPRSSYTVDKTGNDFGAFLHSLEVETLAWYQGVTKEIGYRGLHSLYDFGFINRENDARTASPVVSMHGYHAHPSAFSKAGSQINQSSSVSTSGGYWRAICGTRLLDKPLLVTEHNHGFWNQYLREDGLLFSAYSALQNFSCILVHENAVCLDVKNPVIDFDIGRSPIGRANEVLATCLYRRGDVSPSTHRTELRIDPGYLRSNMNRPANSEQTKLALLTGFGLNLPAPGRSELTRKSDLILSPAEGAAISATDWAAKVGEDKSDTFSLPKAVDALRARGILAKNNLTDPSQGIYQSDTGEIILAAKQNRLTVITPRSEGVTLEAGQSATLSALTVQSTSSPATVALCSLDGKPLRDSGRMLLVYSTEVVNTGMELTEDRVTLLKLGTLPPLLRTGALRLVLNNSGSPTLEVWALGIDGSRREKLPAAVRGKTLDITLDTSKLKSGATPFFEIVAGK